MYSLASNKLRDIKRHHHHNHGNGTGSTGAGADINMMMFANNRETTTNTTTIPVPVDSKKSPSWRLEKAKRRTSSIANLDDYIEEQEPHQEQQQQQQPIPPPIPPPPFHLRKVSVPNTTTTTTTTEQEQEIRYKEDISHEEAIKKTLNQLQANGPPNIPLPPLPPPLPQAGITTSSKKKKKKNNNTNETNEYDEYEYDNEMTLTTEEQIQLMLSRTNESIISDYANLKKINRHSNNNKWSRTTPPSSTRSSLGSSNTTNGATGPGTGVTYDAEYEKTRALKRHDRALSLLSNGSISSS